ncbi:MAG: hypothetical protein AB7O31_12175 [Burkholderiales bacterium]
MNATVDPILLQESYDHSQVPWGGELEFPSTRNLRQLAHRIYNRYPARSISLVPRSILLGLGKSNEGRVTTVLDPFMGSGTTAVEAQVLGFTPMGVELDPFARLIATVRTTALDGSAKSELMRAYKAIGKTWKKTKANKTLTPQLTGIQYWFASKQFLDLLKLKTAIYLETEEGVVRDFLRVTLADMVRPCSKAERQTLKPYISTKYLKAPAEVGAAFDKSFNAHLLAVEEIQSIYPGKRKSIQWLGSDGSNFREPEQSVSVAITSPPYINALDYVRCIKLESAWVDTGRDDVFQTVRKKHVGERIHEEKDLHPAVLSVVGGLVKRIERLDSARARVVRSYFNDMLRNLECVFRALVHGGEYHLIIGNSVVRGVEVETHSITARLAETLGFRWGGYYKYRIRDHRTSIPRKGQGGKIEFEHVISLRKP